MSRVRYFYDTEFIEDGVTIELVFNGDTVSATSQKNPDFSFVASLRSGRKAMLGTYTLKGEQERWCMYRPGTPRPAECR